MTTEQEIINLKFIQRVLEAGTSAAPQDTADALRMCISLRESTFKNASLSLDEQMKQAGMFSVTDILNGTPIDNWLSHALVKDIPSFELWLAMRRKEMLTLQARIDLGIMKKDDDMFEWIVAHNAVFTECHVNLKKALAPKENTH